METNILRFYLNVKLPRPISSYFLVDSTEYKNTSDMERVTELAFCCANGWDMEAAIQKLIDYYEETVEFDEFDALEVLIDLIVFVRTQGYDEETRNEQIPQINNQLHECIKTMRWNWKAFAGILQSELSSYVHWKEDGMKLIFEDKLEIKI